MRAKIIRYINLLSIFYLGLLSRHVAYAQTAAPGVAPVKVYNPIEAESVPQLVNSIVKQILGIVGALALFMFVYGGVLWMTSGGNSSRLEKGRETLIWATIGLVIIFSSYAILNFIFASLTGPS